ncbi:oligosaccharide flippase family protein [Alteromonas gracilis]|uniref:oligosaccharide flippase family protein n=1 Tax=Alteromonas gracilis TaxID=1479524 RepID=UPI0030CB4568
MEKVSKWRRYFAEPHMREMLLGSVVGLVVKVLAAVSLFAMNVVVTRTVGATQAGLFFLSFTLITIIATLGRIGLDQAVVRFIAKDVEVSASTPPVVSGNGAAAGSQLQSVFAKSVTWTLLASVLFAFIFYAIAPWLNDYVFKLPGFTPVFKVMLIAVPVMATYIIYAQALQGLKKISQSMVVSSVLLPSTILLLLLLSPVVRAQEIGSYFVIASVFTLVIGVSFWVTSVPKTAHKTEFPSSILRATCMPLWTVAIVHQVIQWSSQLMLGIWEDAQAVAFFATAQRTAMLTSFILFAVNTIAAPKFAAMHAANDMQGVRRMAIMSVRMMLLVAVPTTLFIFLFPEWLMSMFGEGFSAAATALMILAAGQFVNIATGSVGYLLSMTGLEKKVRDNVLISGAVSVLLGLILIPVYGVIGAAVAYACGVASQNLLGVYQVKKHLGFNTLCFWREA